MMRWILIVSIVGLAIWWIKRKPDSAPTMGEKPVGKLVYCAYCHTLFPETEAFRQEAPSQDTSVYCSKSHMERANTRAR